MADEEKTEHHHCYGCARQLGEVGVWDHGASTEVTLFGEDRRICTNSRGGGYYAKQGCIDKAVKKLMKERTCPVCGTEVGDSYGSQAYSTQLCSECDFILDWGREHHDKEESTTREIQVAALAALVEKIANYDTIGERGNFGKKVVPVFPFNLLDGEEFSKPAHALMTALRGMWESNVEKALAEGQRKGRNLLVSLKTGDITVGEFDEKVEKGHEDYRKREKEYEEQCVAAVEAALALLERGEKRDE